MALDWYVLGGPQDAAPEVQLDFDALQALEPALDVLRQRTGVFVDAYGRTRLSPDHAQIVLANLPSVSKRPKTAAEAQIAEFAAVLERAVEAGEWLIGYGD